MSAVEGALGSGPETEAVLASLRRLRARTLGHGGLLDEAIATMRGLGFDVTRLPTGEDVVHRVLDIVPSGATAVCHPCVVSRALGLADVLRAQGRSAVVLPGDGEPAGPNGSWREHLLAAQVGITGASALVADTGSVMLAEDLGFGRAASNVPPVHIALATADSVVETLLDAAVIARGYAVMHLGRAMPRYISLISGPSKTADIGFTLVHGMHGPQTVHVLVWARSKSDGTDDAALMSWVLG